LQLEFKSLAKVLSGQVCMASMEDSGYSSWMIKAFRMSTWIQSEHKTHKINMQVTFELYKLQERY